MDKISNYHLLFCMLALGAGCVMALQPAVNGRLASQCSHPIQASIISFATGTLTLLVIGLIMQIGLPALGKLSMLPWWAWTGGMLGTYMVTVSLLVAPKFGGTRWIALVLTGQITLALLLDHFGYLGFPQQSINWPRLLGITLVAVGAILVTQN